MKRTDGKGMAEPLPIESDEPYSSDWSRDGRFILFQAWAAGKTGWDLWALPMEDKRAPVAVAQTTYDEREGRFSPDGRFVAYESAEGPGKRREIVVSPFPPDGTETRWRISTSGGRGPQWREDGRELFYVDRDGYLMAVTIRPEPTFEWDPPERLFQTVFDGDGYTSYAVSSDGQRFLINVPREDAMPITVLTNWRASLPK